ncbi:MAG: winged helix-turn-helix transcriptional regulator [Planctomycetes bacterium]|jgi:DNA-binding Xre family transcriptional regulator|nr:winged helix-turn-helix transcriptional regulator [Planctomycetota bacterium]
MPGQVRTRQSASDPADDAGWTFLTNHSHVLLCLAADPEMRLRDVASRVGITERAVQAIVQDLEEAGAITRTRVGRCNRYDLHPDHRLHHPVEAHCKVGDLIAMVLGPRPRRAQVGSRPRKQTGR